MNDLYKLRDKDGNLYSPELVKKALEDHMFEKLRRIEMNIDKWLAVANSQKQNNT